MLRIEGATAGNFSHAVLNSSSSPINNTNINNTFVGKALSTCSQYSGETEGMCSLCTSQTSLLGDCFWCAEDQSCHDYGSIEFPSSCWDMGCVSHSTVTSCVGSCADETVPSGFDVSLAQCMLAISNASYYNGKTLDIAMDAIGISSYKSMANSSVDTEGVVVAHTKANAITIAYRGTELNLKNGALDIDCVFEKYQTKITSNSSTLTQGWEVANGFCTAFLSLFEDMQANIEWAFEQVGSKPKLYVTGHSLGGAMATIAASDLLVNDLSDQVSSIEVLTFAAPRAGNPTFAEGVGDIAGTDNWWTVQNFFDQIPHLPTRSMGFQHVENIIIIGPNEGNIVEVTPSQEDEHFNITANPIDFHHVSAYMELLNSLEGAQTGDVQCTASILTT